MTGTRAGTPPIPNQDTPRLLLDRERFERNTIQMRTRCVELGVALRPHLKTAKSAHAALVAGPGVGPITVSTIAEAEYFAAAGWRDILYATAMTPAKVGRAARVQTDTGARLTLVADNASMISQIGETARAERAVFTCLCEVDCGEHRGGVRPASDELLAVAAAIASNEPHLILAGVMTHAGHSYALQDPPALGALAETERAAAVNSALMLRSRGYDCPVVSVGSTPTILYAHHLRGVTEVRAGIYMFWDLAQLSRGNCKMDDIAVTVLATVIGHQRNGPSLVIDAGALALSKDVSANPLMPDADYGWVCNSETMQRYASLSVGTVHQEHGTIPISDLVWFDRLPIGSRVRIIPNHACLTCAAYSSYDVMSGDHLVDTWDRVRGW